MGILITNKFTKNSTKKDMKAFLREHGAEAIYIGCLCEPYTKNWDVQADGKDMRLSMDWKKGCWFLETKDGDSAFRVKFHMCGPEAQIVQAQLGKRAKVLGRWYEAPAFRTDSFLAHFKDQVDIAHKMLLTGMLAYWEE